MGLFDSIFKNKRNPEPLSGPVQISDKLEELFSKARLETNESERTKAATEFTNILAELNDVDLLHAIYQKQPYKEEGVKQLVAQRYLEILSGMTDVYEVLKYTGGKYTHLFSNHASLTIVNLVSQMEDQEVLRKILDAGSGFDHRAKDIAQLKLNHENMSTQELMDIVDYKGSTPQHRALATGYITDMEKLTELALNLSNLFEVVLTAQILVIEATADIAVLHLIKETAKGFGSHTGYEHIPATIAEMVDKRIAEIRN